MKTLNKLAAIVFAVLVMSCEMVGGIGEIEPENVLTDETLIVDAQSAETAVNGVYASWRNIYIGYMRHLMSFRSGSENVRYISGYQDFVRNDIKPENAALDKNYAGLYGVVNMANSVLAQLEKEVAYQGLSASRRLEMVAEAKFQRAMAHFMLLRQYGEFFNLNSEFGVVTNLEPVRGNHPKSRSSVAETYRVVVDDLKEVALHAPEMPQGHYYVSQLTGKAFLAKVYLSMNDFVNASTLAQEVIEQAPLVGYNLETEYLDIFEKGFHSDEVLFALYTSYPNEPSIVYSPASLKSGNSLILVADELVAGDGDMFSGEGFDPRFAALFSDVALGYSGRGNNKYIKEDYVSGQPGNTYFFLRLAEVYLIRAEAEARLAHYDEARVALKVVCDRAGYADDYVETIADEALTQSILHHKWVELCVENNEEWFDLVRYHLLDGFAFSPVYVKTGKLLLPIPKAALAGNNLLKQNPEYL